MASKNKRGKLIVISAPSGAGKTTVIRCLTAKHPEMVHSISCTTRPPRPDSMDRRDYTFTDKKKFKRWIEEGRFAEWAEVHDHLYGTPREPLDEWILDGVDVLLDVDVVGGINLKKLYKDDAVLIFLLPPSIEELKKRLSHRATDSKEAQELRLKNALKELTYKNKYDYQVINDDLDRACAKIEKIIFKP